MPQLSDEQLARVAYDAGFRGDVLVNMVAIALRESRGNSDAVGDKDNPRKGCGSYGLWQINSCPNSGAGPPRYADNPRVLLDPTVNAQAAFLLSRQGTWLQPWTSYRSGIPSYLPWVPRAQAAVSRIDTTAASPTSPVPGAASDYAGAAAAADGTATGGGIGGALAMLTSGKTWLRVAGFVAGSVLVLVAANMLMQDTVLETVDKMT